MNGVSISTGGDDTELNNSEPLLIQISIAVDLLGNYIRSDSKRFRSQIRNHRLSLAVPSR